MQTEQQQETERWHRLKALRMGTEHVTGYFEMQHLPQLLLTSNPAPKTVATCYDYIRLPDIRYPVWLRPEANIFRFPSSEPRYLNLGNNEAQWHWLQAAGFDF